MFLNKKFLIIFIFLFTMFFVGNGINSYAQDVLASNGKNYINYAVRSGDTIWKISNKFNITSKSLINMNSTAVSNINNIYIGQILKIPTNYINYIVKSGDTLWKISSKMQVTIEQIKTFNVLSSNYLYIGQNLKIPTSKAITINQGTTSSGVNSITYYTYTVVSGDDLWKLSIKFGIPLTELLKVNGLTRSSVLKIGQKITVPVHHIAVKSTPGAKYGEYLDWWTEAQYVFPINKVAKVTDFVTGKSFKVQRIIGANHADCEPLTASDTAIMYQIWGGYSWVQRACILEVDGRKVACSLTFYPHDIESIKNNNFEGHFDIHFKNSTTHNTGVINEGHQIQIKIAAGKG